MKKLIIIVVVIVGLIVLGLISPWNNLKISFSQLFGYGSIDNSSGLKVFPLVGELDIYLDGEYKGSVKPEDIEPFEIFEIEPGIHPIRIVRKSEPTGSYVEFNRSINFEEDVDVIISYELGPTLDFSEGHIFYAEKKIDNTKTTLNIISSPEGSSIYIDDQFVGETPYSDFEIDLSGKHKIRLEKEGYETIEFEILPDSQDSRDKLAGFKLNLEVNLFIPPLKINEVSTDNGSN